MGTTSTTRCNNESLGQADRKHGHERELHSARSEDRGGTSIEVPGGQSDRADARGEKSNCTRNQTGTAEREEEDQVRSQAATTEKRRSIVRTRTGTSSELSTLRGRRSEPMQSSKPSACLPSMTRAARSLM